MPDRIFMRRSRGRVVFAILLIGLGLVCVWGYGLVRFSTTIPEDVTDSMTQTDAIVVLTGGSERLETGLRLLAEGKSRMLFVSGVHEGVDSPELLRVVGTTNSGLAQRVAIGHGAKNTQGNALETAAWMAGHSFRSLRLVTASYHMPRSLLEFRNAMPEVTVIPHPVFPRHVKREAWWRWPGTTALIIGEYNKHLIATAEHWVHRRLNSLSHNA